MKKFLFLLFCLAFGTFYFLGMSDSTITKQSSQLSASQTPSTPDPTASTTTDQTSLRDRVYRIMHFRAVAEGKLDRDQYIPLAQIPQIMQQSIVATEDKRFYEHGPIDFIGIGRAALVNIQSGKTMEGGSTITQQVVKNVFLSPERTLSRKAEELVLSILLERNYTKEEILTMYLNTAYFGASAYGINDAARIYFGTTPPKLTLAQCAMLAGLPQAPTYLNPLANYEAAKARQQIVLALMTEQNFIGPDQAKQAYQADLDLTNEKSTTSNRAKSTKR